MIILYKNSVGKWHSVSRLVAKTFIENPENLPQVNHIDENKLNNKADNLEWISAKDNVRYSKAKAVIGVNIKTGEITFHT